MLCNHSPKTRKKESMAQENFEFSRRTPTSTPTTYGTKSKARSVSVSEVHPATTMQTIAHTANDGENLGGLDVLECRSSRMF